MEKIKSIRLRKSNIKNGNLDIKITVYKDINLFSKDEIIIDGSNNGRIVWKESRYKQNGVYKDYTIDDFINLFIITNNKLDGNTTSTNYTIIQDPWLETPPVIRNYGFDPYYLNNGAQIFIKWVNNTTVAGGTKYSDDNGNELFDPLITKTFFIIHKDISYMLSIDKNNNFIRKSDSKEYSIKDENILQDIIAIWRSNVSNYNLELCNPNNESCYIIEFKDPTTEPKQEIDPITKLSTNETPIEKINVVLPSETIKAKVDITSFKVYIGKPKLIDDNTNDEDNYILNTNESDILSTFNESEFEGLDEVELDLQNDISDGQEDSDSNIGDVGAANIRPVGSLDDLLRLAGDCARELGKNKRVNYDNLRIGFVKGIHGLCPQGTLSVLYALTGVKKLGNINGNANSFSMNGGNSFPSSHFNNKIRVGRDYFNDGSLWQIGDIIAIDYLDGKPYGHIQIWTGTKWISDFTQNRLQVNHINWNSVALHRMNSNGLDAVRKQTL